MHPDTNIAENCKLAADHNLAIDLDRYCIDVAIGIGIEAVRSGGGLGREGSKGGSDGGD